MQYPFFFGYMFNTKIYDKKENITIYALNFIYFEIVIDSNI